VPFWYWVHSPPATCRCTWWRRLPSVWPGWPSRHRPRPSSWCCPSSTTWSDATPPAGSWSTGPPPQTVGRGQRTSLINHSRPMVIGRLLLLSIIEFKRLSSAFWRTSHYVPPAPSKRPDCVAWSGIDAVNSCCFLRTAHPNDYTPHFLPSLGPHLGNTPASCSARSVPVWNGEIACSFLKDRSSKKLDTALPWILSNTHAECEVDWMLLRKSKDTY